MRKQYQILNGDSLKQQLPKDILGEIIVARECLVDGSVEGNDLDELFRIRSKFLSQNYGGTEQDYYLKTVPEFKKIEHITPNSDINLWFEEDLFCQVNFWFIIHLLNQSENNNPIFLIQPKKHSQYGFGGLNKRMLESIHKNRILLTELNKLADLWGFYKNDNLELLLKTARDLESQYPFILTAVIAHIERIPTEGDLGRPSRSLVQKVKELKTVDFETVFKEFNKREYIYGFGDLQVKRLFDKLHTN